MRKKIVYLKINFEINEEKEYAELSESKKKLYDYFTKTTK